MRRTSVVFTLFLAAFSTQLFAGSELTITNNTDTLVLDRQELQSFPQTTIVTRSPFFEGEVEFSGPTLERILESFGLSGETQLTLRALNDYAVTGSVEELISLDAIVAIRRESKTMSVRDRGPFWVMLPLSDRPELDQENFHRYMVWQLNRLELE